MSSRTTFAATHFKDGPLTSGEAEAAFLRRSERPNGAMGDLELMPGGLPFDRASAPSPENARRIAWLYEHDADDLP